TPVLVSLLAAEPEDRPTAAHACEMLTDVSYGDEPNFGHLATVVRSNPAMTAVVPSDDRTQVVSPSDPAPGTTRVVSAAPAPAGEYGDYDQVGPPARGRNRGPLVVTGLALAIIAGFGIWFFTGNRPENPHHDPDHVQNTVMVVDVDRSNRRRRLGVGG